MGNIYYPILLPVHSFVGLNVMKTECVRKNTSHNSQYFQQNTKQKFFTPHQKTSPSISQPRSANLRSCKFSCISQLSL